MSKSAWSWSRPFEQLGFSRSKKRAGRNVNPGRKARGLSVEPLERRELLSVCTWTGLGTDNNWKTATNWSNNVAPVAGDQLVFAGAKQTTTNNNYTAGTSFQSIEFQNSGFSLGGNSIALSGGTAITVDSGASGETISLGMALGSTEIVNVAGNGLTVGGTVSGSGGLTKSGTGTLTLTGANTYTGITTISQGTLSASSVVVNGGSSNLGNASSAVVLGGASSGGTLSYTGNTATFTRGFTLSAGGGEIDVTTSGQNLTVSSVISGSGPLATGGAGTLTPSGANTYTGGTTINGGVLSVATIADTGNSNFSTGSVEINGGTLQYTGSSAATTTRAFSIVQTATNGAINVANATGSLAINFAFSGVGSSQAIVTKSGPGTLILGGSVDNYLLVLDAENGTVDLNKSTSIFGSVHAVYGISNIAAGATVVITGAGGNQIYAGNATSSGWSGVVNLGGGTLDLDGNSGGWLRSTGTGTITNNSSSGTPSTVSFGPDFLSDTFGGTIKDGLGKVSFVKINAGTVVLTGANTYTGGTTISGGTLQLGNGSSGYDGSLSNTGGIVDNSNLTYDLYGQPTYRGTISGTGSVTLNGSGGLLLTGANTYTGGTTINGGTMSVTGSIAGAVTVSGGTLSGTGTVGSVTVNSGAVSPAGSGTIGTLTINGNLDLAGSAATYDADISNNGSDTIDVTGTVTISTSANLNLSDSGLTNFVQLFTLIDQEGSRAVSGSFTGLTEGSSVNVNGVKYYITYQYNSATSTFGNGYSVALVSSELGTSPNWSGYAAATSPSPETDSVSAVSGNWTVPSVSGSGTTCSCVWVGIDGFGGSTVEQIGTEQDVVNGTADYYAWWRCTQRAISSPSSRSAE